MKNFRCLTAILITATMFVSFNACSDDDEDDKKEENLIVGKWKSLDPDEEGEILEYKSNGTLEWTDINDPNYSETGIYKFVSGDLQLLFDGDSNWKPFKIHELNSTSLITERYYDGELSGYKYKFERIK